MYKKKYIKYKYKYLKDGIGGGSEDDKICVICQDKINDDDNVLTFECNHIYHDICILKYYIDMERNRHEINFDCPTCRDQHIAIFPVSRERLPFLDIIKRLILHSKDDSRRVKLLLKFLITGKDILSTEIKAYIHETILEVITNDVTALPYFIRIMEKLDAEQKKEIILECIKKDRRSLIYLKEEDRNKYKFKLSL